MKNTHCITDEGKIIIVGTEEEMNFMVIRDEVVRELTEEEKKTYNDV